MPTINTLNLPQFRAAPQLFRPMATDGTGVEPPDNSEVRKIAEDVLGATKMSFAAVAATPDARVAAGSVEEIFKRAIKDLPGANRPVLQNLAEGWAATPEVVRAAEFGRAGTRSFAEHLNAGGLQNFDIGLAELNLDQKLLGVESSVRMPLYLLRNGGLGDAGLFGDGIDSVDDLEDAVRMSNVAAAADDIGDENRLADLFGMSLGEDPWGDGVMGDSGQLDDAVTDKMEFWLHRVKCIDETNPEFWGNDEIAIAGIEIDENGDTKKIGEQRVGSGFKDGRSRRYVRKFTWFNMRENGNNWPKSYSVSLLLAEKDNGGFSKWLDGVWKKVRDKVKEAVAKAVAKLAESYIGPALARIVGQAAAWIVDVFAGWLIKALKDDVFPPFTARVTTPSMSARWNYANGRWGNPSSGRRLAYFNGHGGRYSVEYEWRFAS
ncbi:MAG: hypothetical protein GY708_30180 [Actinomycetia bacterium]|nr:hypothetical protein [Actinomycetes bacterium]